MGEFKQLYSYNKIIKNSLEALTEYHFSFLTPACMQKLNLEFAQGLDDMIDDEDRKNNVNVCKFVVVNGA